MNDRQFREQKARVLKLKDKWHERLGLGWWRITYIWQRHEDSEPTTYEPRVVGDRFAVIMRTSTDWNYRQAQITCMLDNVKELDDEVLEDQFLHEIMHIFLAPMRTKQHAGDEELVATTLARAFRWTEEALLEEKTK